MKARIFATTARYAAIICITIILALTILGAYGGCFNPARSVLPAMACLAFPYLIAFTMILAVVLWIVRWRKMAATSALAILICLPSLLDICPLHFSALFKSDIADRSEPSDTFSVMTFNAYYFNSFQNIDLDSTAANASAIAILEADPSIVIMQEAMPIDPFEVGRRKVDNTVSAAIRERYPYRFFSPKSMAIMSKHPFRRLTVPYDSRDEQSFILDRFSVSIGDSTVEILDVHLQSLMIPGSELSQLLKVRKLLTSPKAYVEAYRVIKPRVAGAFRKRAWQASSIRRIINDMGATNLIVCGDFNDVPTCYAERIIMGDDLTDCYAASAFGPTTTYRAHHLYFRIDQMLCARSLRPLLSRRVNAGGSDHYPLMTTFTFAK